MKVPHRLEHASKRLRLGSKQSDVWDLDRSLGRKSSLYSLCHSLTDSEDSITNESPSSSRTRSKRPLLSSTIKPQSDVTGTIVDPTTHVSSIMEEVVDQDGGESSASADKTLFDVDKTITELIGDGSRSTTKRSIAVIKDGKAVSSMSYNYSNDFEDDVSGSTGSRSRSSKVHKSVSVVPVVKERKRSEEDSWTGIYHSFCFKISRKCGSTEYSTTIWM